jgi:putative transposase
MTPKDLLEDYLIDQEERNKEATDLVLDRVMKFEATQQSCSEPYYRIESRKAHRNGYKNRSMKTSVDEINLKKPQFREYPFETEVF